MGNRIQSKVKGGFLLSDSSFRKMIGREKRQPFVGLFIIRVMSSIEEKSGNGRLQESKRGLKLVFGNLVV